MAKVYVKTDTKSVITAINSDTFLRDITGYTLIDEGYGDRYTHAQNNYLEKGLCDLKGRYNYKLANDSVVELTDGEKEMLFPVSQPSFEESQMDINIDTDYRISCLELGI